VRVELTAAPSAVLLSDFHAWHFVLNYWYLPRNVADGDRFDKWLPSRRVDVNDLKSRRVRDHAVEQAVERSWEKIFTVTGRTGASKPTCGRYR
jgi:hypothetical protein